MFAPAGGNSQQRGGSGGGAGAAPEVELERLEREICELAADINAATCRWLSLVAEFERLGGPERAGFFSATAWLAWTCSLTQRAAREQLRVARRLAELPAIRSEFARGGLSYSKVRALTRVATPALEAELLEFARHASAAQLESTVRELRRALADGDPGLVSERRHLALRWEGDGMLRVSGVLPAEEGELLVKSIEAARESLRAEGPDDWRPDRADGIGALAESFLATGPGAAQGGERNQVVMHVDLERLGSGDCGSAAVGGGSVDSGAARRVACDAAIVTLVERAGEPLSVGRKTRSIPPAVNRALRARDGGCRFPGCTHARYVDGHHIRHWADGGETSVGNLVLLCRRHHRLVHEGGFSIDKDGGGALVFRRPDGTEAGSSRARRGLRPMPGLGRSLPEASGDPLDLEHTAMVLAARAAKGGAARGR